MLNMKYDETSASTEDTAYATYHTYNVYTIFFLLLLFIYINNLFTVNVNVFQVVCISTTVLSENQLI